MPGGYLSFHHETLPYYPSLVCFFLVILCYFSSVHFFPVIKIPTYDDVRGVEFGFT
jgi:hypothetical protein